MTKYFHAQATGVYIEFNSQIFSNNFGGNKACLDVYFVPIGFQDTASPQLKKRLLVMLVNKTSRNLFWFFYKNEIVIIIERHRLEEGWTILFFDSQVAHLYPQTSPCQQHDCKHGICMDLPGTNDYICKCAPGYSGVWGSFLDVRKFSWLLSPSSVS